MSIKRLAIIACAFGAMSAASPALAQGFVTAPALSVTPERAKGAELRRVTQESTRLVYEYQTPTGAARVHVDPSSLIGDIERARRASPKKAVKPMASAAPAPREEMQRSEIAQASMVEPAVESEPTVRADRKVRVIPLYNTPKLD